MIVKRGDIYYADLRPVIGSEQGGLRPVLIIQNDMGNRYSPTVICAAITSQLHKAKLPTHVALDAHKYGIVKDSVILLILHYVSVCHCLHKNEKISTTEKTPLGGGVFPDTRRCQSV